MNKITGYTLVTRAILLAGAVAAFAQAQAPAPSVTREITEQFTQINKQLLDMAKDFPAEKYSYRMRPEMRSFGEVIVHVASGNAYAAKKGRGEQVKWDEIDPKGYKTKEAIVALLEKSIADSTATLKALPAAALTKSVNPWLGVTEHSAEHYGLLVAYYRINGMVPPESRPKGK